ncbi:MAG TPA: CoA-binding protein [Roseiarcus sp.]|nr:CoA-binding protein [Roseiarcus sp.]
MSGHVLAPRRAPYSFAELERLVQPRSVSVIGASDTPGSFGANTMANIQAGFEGRLYPVNPNRQTVFGLKCWPSVSALPEPVDLAVLIIPAASVPAALTECADCGVGSAVIYSRASPSSARPRRSRPRPPSPRSPGPAACGCWGPTASAWPIWR